MTKDEMVDDMRLGKYVVLTDTIASQFGQDFVDDHFNEKCRYATLNNAKKAVRKAMNTLPKKQLTMFEYFLNQDGVQSEPFAYINGTTTMKWWRCVLKNGSVHILQDQLHQHVSPEVLGIKD